MGKLNLKMVKTNPTTRETKMDIIYGFGTTNLGCGCLIGIYNEQVCFLAFSDLKNKKDGLKGLKQDWPYANLIEDNERIQPFIDKIFYQEDEKPVDVFLQGTDFQIKVWAELINLKEGATASYSDIAEAIGKPKAVRAVASAIARNKVSYLVPCHRIVRKTGAIHKYRWGPKTKLLLLKHEAKITK